MSYHYFQTQNNENIVCIFTDEEHAFLPCLYQFAPPELCNSQGWKAIETAYKSHLDLQNKNKDTLFSVDTPLYCQAPRAQGCITEAELDK